MQNEDEKKSGELVIFLQSENATLTKELKRLEEISSGMQCTYFCQVPPNCTDEAAQQSGVLLQEERQRSKLLDEQIAQLKIDSEKLLQNEQQTISLLVSEKSSLTSELERLEGLETRAFVYSVILAN